MADATARFDRERKGRVYARTGVPEYWILNLESRTLEVYRQPQGEAYGELVVLGGDEVTPLERSGASVAVSELLP